MYFLYTWLYPPYIPPIEKVAAVLLANKIYIAGANKYAIYILDISELYILLPSFELPKDQHRKLGTIKILNLESIHVVDRTVK